MIPLVALLLPPSRPNDLENQNFEKMKKASGDIIILHLCTQNHNHMNASQDMKCNRHNFFVILDHFLPFYTIIEPKN